MCAGIICLLGLAQGCTCGEDCTCRGEFELSDEEEPLEEPED